MTIDLSLTQGAKALPKSPANIVARLGFGSILLAGGVPLITEWDGGQAAQVPGVNGYGPVQERTSRALKIKGMHCITVQCPCSIPGTLSSVTQTGGGSPIVASCPGGLANAPYQNLEHLLVTCVTSGALGAAQVQVAYDGANGQGYVDVPYATPASLQGTADLTALVYASPAVMTGTVVLAGSMQALDGETLTGMDVDATGPLTVTFSHPFDALALVAQFNAVFPGAASLTAAGHFQIRGVTLGATGLVTCTAGTARAALGLPAATTVNGIDAALDGETLPLVLTVAPAAPVTTTITFGQPTGPADVLAAIVATGVTPSLVGGKHLLLTTVAGGPGVRLAKTSGTADTNLGFAATPSAVGADPYYDIPNLGVRLTFPTGSTYTAGTTYGLVTACPRMSITDMQTGLAALRASGIPFAAIYPCQEAQDVAKGGGGGEETLSFAQALDSTVSGWWTASANKIYPRWYLGGPLGAENSPTGSADAHAVQDAETKAALNGYTSDYGLIAAGDIYLTGQEFPGSFRNSMACAIVERVAAYRLSADPGNGTFPPPELSSWRSPLGAPARDESTALVKLGNYGFSVGTVENSVLGFAGGVTRSAPGSLEVTLGIARLGAEAMRILYAVLQSVKLVDVNLTPSGHIGAPDANAYDGGGGPGSKGVFGSNLTTFLVTPGHASAAYATLDRSQVVQPDGSFPFVVTFTIQVKGQIKAITGTVSLVATLS